MECSGIEAGEGFTDGDVALAIGRVICARLGIQMNYTVSIAVKGRIDVDVNAAIFLVAQE